MKKIIFPLLAAAAVIAAPAAYARTMHESGAWNVLLDGNSNTCFAANRGATGGEVKVGGPYVTQAKADAAMGAAIQCATPQTMD
jgi:hypothetical protein